MTYPVAAKALLRAEEAVLNVLLQARRALQRAGLLVAVGTSARPGFGSNGGHYASSGVEMGSDGLDGLGFQ